jgi:hypothetical protein
MAAGVVAALGGCHASPGESDPDSPDDSAQEGDCPIVDSLFDDVVDEPDRTGLAQRVAWSNTLASEAVVRFGDGEVTLETPPLAPDVYQQAVLAGLGAGEEVTWQIRARRDEAWVCSAQRTYRTGELDQGFPSLTVELDTEGSRQPLALVPLLTQEISYLALFDRRGVVIWAAPITSNERRGIPDSAGTAFLLADQAYNPDSSARLSWMSWGGERTEAGAAVGMHTDVALLPDGTMATLGWDLREFDDDGEVRRILGDTLLEIGQDGQTRQVWSVYDDFQPDLSVDYATGWVPDDPTVEDWSHMNGLSYSSVEDTYYVSITGLGLVAAIARQTGSLLWSAGGPSASIQGEPGLVASPHSVYRLPDGDFLVFNRDQGSCSHVNRFAVDPVARTTESHWSYTSPDCLSVEYLGDARFTSDEHYLISWSSAGRLEEVDESGVSLRRIDAPMGWTFGFVEDLDTWPGYREVPEP